MSVKDVKAAEEIVNNMVQKNELVYAKETVLANAKSIQGLRAVFDEVRIIYGNLPFFLLCRSFLGVYGICLCGVKQFQGNEDLRIMTTLKPLLSLDSSDALFLELYPYQFFLWSLKGSFT